MGEDGVDVTAAFQRYLVASAVTGIPRSPAYQRPPAMRYAGVRRIRLAWYLPPASGASHAAVLAALLRDTAGPVHIEQTTSTARGFMRAMSGAGWPPPTDRTRSLTITRHPVPSGGDFHPAELYVHSTGDASLPPGTYHYDATHHALAEISAGGRAGALHAALGSEPAPITLFLTCRVWKNAVKYGSFGYRLGCLDLGVVLGQVLTRSPVPGRVRLLFEADRVDALLGLDPELQTTYAVVELAVPKTPAPRGDRPGEPTSPPPADLAPDRRGREMVAPAAADFYRRCLVVHNGSVGDPRTREPARSIALPPPGGLDLRAAPRRSRSAAVLAGDALTLAELSGLLAALGSGYDHDLGGESDHLRQVRAYCAVVSVGGLAAGVYRYDPGAHRLVPQSGRDIRRLLTTPAFLKPTAPFAAAPLRLFLAGRYQPGFETVGARWYRVLNIEAGLAAQRCYLAGGALGLACRALLSYRIDQLDEFLELTPPWTALLQVVVGRRRPWPGAFEVSLTADHTGPAVNLAGPV